MNIKRLHPGEISAFRDLIEIFHTVFENERSMPDDVYLGNLLSNPDFMTFVVKVEGKVVGGATIYVLHSYYSSKPMACIYDVGISAAFQGKGFGKALIAEVCSFCKHNGFEDAYVESESDDVDAVGFYRKTRASREINATHFTYTFVN